MKFFLIIVLYFLWVNLGLYGQLTPEWQSVIYIRDAKGNRDSLQIGLHGDISVGINPEFGEIEEPKILDSVLDIRGIEFLLAPDFNYPYIFTNPLISGAYMKDYARTKECYWQIQRLNIGVFAKYQPVTISWDQGAFQDECLSGSCITTDYLSETVYQWHKYICDNQYQCLAGANSVTWYLPNGCSKNIGFNRSWRTVLPTSDGRMDTLWNMQIIPAFTYYFDTPCRFSSVDDDTEDSLLIYPNPTHASLTIQSDRDISEYRIFRSDGVLEQSGLYFDMEIDLLRLSEGIKWLEIHYKNGHIIRRSFLKL